MSLGTAYIHHASPRPSFISTMISYLKLDYTVKSLEFGVPDAEFQSKFPLGQTPALELADKSKLTETIALATYLAESSKSDSEFFGPSTLSKASNLRWMQFVNGDFIGNVSPLLFMAIGKMPVNKSDVEAKYAKYEKQIEYMESHLSTSKYFGGNESAGLGDFYAAYIFTRCYAVAWDKQWAEEHPLINNWFNDVISNYPFCESIKTTVPCEKGIDLKNL